MARRRTLAIVALVLAAILLAVAIRAHATFNTGRSDFADDRVPLSRVRSTDRAAIARGEYVARAGDCTACHTAGHGMLAGGYTIATGFGTLTSSNITPDPETGIGRMTERDFANALRQGIGQHGLLYPGMPFDAFAKLSDRDVHDLWAYMATVKPVHSAIDETAGMHFPFNIRLAMAGWDMLFFRNRGFGGDPQAERGRYLVEAAGHCAACHTPRNILGATKASADLHGAIVGAWYAPDITSNPHLGIGAQPAERIARYLRTGANGVEVAAGPMAEAVEHSLQYLTPADAQAIARYLKSVPPSPARRPAPMPGGTAAMRRAALDYEVNCSACHGLRGEGMVAAVPALAGNAGLLADPTGVIHAMLVGARAPATAPQPTAAGMPSFAWKFDDARIAALLDYVRNSWGNAAPPVAPAQVQDMRGSLNARQPLRNPAPAR